MQLRVYQMYANEYLRLIGTFAFLNLKDLGEPLKPEIFRNCAIRMIISQLLNTIECYARQSLPICLLVYRKPILFRRRQRDYHLRMKG